MFYLKVSEKYFHMFSKHVIVNNKYSFERKMIFLNYYYDGYVI